MALNIRTDSGDEPDLMVEMNSTPLIDVMLVLLVMLIITIPIQLNSVNIELPASSAEPPQPPPVVRIDIAPTGQVRWDGEALPDQPTLLIRLQAAAAQPIQPEIHLHPDPHTKYDVVAAVLAASQRLGLQKIGLVNAQSGEAPPTPAAPRS